MTCVLASVGMFFAAIASTPAHWNYAWDLPNSDAPDGFVRVDLNEELVDVSAPTLADVRIVPKAFQNVAWDEAQASQVPYMLYHPPSGETHVEEWKPLQVINRVYEPDQYEQLVLDFGESRLKNSIKVELSGQNFQRAVTVEGGSDGQSWDTIHEDAWLFDISQPFGNYVVDTVDFPVNNYRYLRLTVFHSETDPRRVDVKSVRAVHQASLEPALIEVPVLSQEQAVDEQNNVTDIVLDLGYRHLPLARIEVATESPYFHRAFELLGRNAVAERIPRKTETGWDDTEQEVPWTTVARGVLFRIATRQGETREDLAIECRAPYRYLRLQIHNQDNPPLALGPIAIYRHPLPSLVIENDPQTPLLILTGNPQAPTPRYDLAQSVRDLDVTTLPSIAIQTAPHDRSVQDEKPWTARNAWVIWLALLPAVLVMGGLIWANLAKMRQEDRAKKPES